MPSEAVLAVVIPVYNEERNITPLLEDWQPVFSHANVPHRVILIDDGSKDGSLSLLRTRQEGDPTLEVHTQTNAGHGPAILKGYRLAADAQWVFQIDSDHQVDTAAFSLLWENRDRYDLLLAQRLGKNASPGRRGVSAFSTLIVRLLYGKGVKDVNVPYRLMRGSMLREALDVVPEKSFAPNILLTAWFIRRKKRIFTTETTCRNDGLARASKMSWYFFRGVIRSTLQTILFRMRS